MGKNILLVDDDAQSRKVIRTLVEEIPDIGEIWEADNGDAALQQVKSNVPDVIFMDINMPVNGFETTQIILQEFPNVFIIMLTVYPQKSFVKKALASGATGYMVKKNLHRELYGGLEKVLNGECFVSAAVE